MAKPLPDVVGPGLRILFARWRPRLVVVVGIGAWRAAFAHPRAGLGLQADRVGGRPVRMLPNPSGLSAHHQLADLGRRFAKAAGHADGIPAPDPAGSGR